MPPLPSPLEMELCALDPLPRLHRICPQLWPPPLRHGHSLRLACWGHPMHLGLGWLRLNVLLGLHALQVAHGPALPCLGAEWLAWRLWGRWWRSTAGRWIRPHWWWRSDPPEGSRFIHLHAFNAWGAGSDEHCIGVDLPDVCHQAFHGLTLPAPRYPFLPADSIQQTGTMAEPQDGISYRVLSCAYAPLLRQCCAIVGMPYWRALRHCANGARGYGGYI